MRSGRATKDRFAVRYLVPTYLVIEKGGNHYQCYLALRAAKARRHGMVVTVVDCTIDVDDGKRTDKGGRSKAASVTVVEYWFQFAVYS